MLGRFSPVDVEAAREDLCNRSLAKIGLKFARLIYLASTRDYNTGCYYHDGLAFQFSEALAAKVLSTFGRTWSRTALPYTSKVIRSQNNIFLETLRSLWQL